MNCNISQNCVAIIKSLEKSFFEQFPKPENYFNKIEGFEKHSINNEKLISGSRITGRMTNQFLQNKFKLIEDEMQNSINSFQKPSESCIIS